MSSIITELVIIGVLLILNGIFSMSELAIVTAKRVRLEHHADRGNAGAKAALALATNPSEFLSTVQVGITLVGVIASVYGGATIAAVLAARLSAVPWLAEHAQAASLFIVVAVITYLSVIVGELVPKRIALGSPERVAMIVARPMRAISRIGSPLVRLLTGSTQLILRLFGVKGMPEPGLTEDEIHAVVEQGAESGVVPIVEHEIVENVFRLGDRHVSAVMAARTDVEWIDIDSDADDIRAVIEQQRPDWLLVCSGNIETVRGIVYASDLLAQCLTGKSISLQTVLDEPLYVATTMPVFKLLSLFRETKKRVAIVLDEYGGIDGVVSLGDILSGLVGAPTLSTSRESPTLTRAAESGWIADGSIDIDILAEAIDLPGLDTPARRDYRTLAGLIMERSGRVPNVGDIVSISGFTFRIQSMDGRRIDKVRIDRAVGEIAAPPSTQR
ncbi:MAG TPA: hemolysin family protein [Gemmatimonadaceae bacterium]